VLPFRSTKLSAGIPFTVRSLASTVPGSTGQMKLTKKSVGGVKKVLPQTEMIAIQGAEVGVGVSVAVGVPVTVTVAVGVVVGVALGLSVGVGVAVGVGVGVPVELCTSNEPLSIRPFTTRLNPGPRWSKKGGGVKFGSPASIAGLPGNKAWVNVGPPLSCKGPSTGSVLI